MRYVASGTMSQERLHVRFGACTLDSQARELRRDGRPVDLSAKAFDLLAELLRERPAVVTKERLRDLLWPKTFVAETSLPRLVAEVRKAIGDDDPEAPLVRTVHRFGYAFAGAAVDVPPSAHAAAGTLLWAGRHVTLAPGPNLMGREPDCLVRIVSPRVSRHHARITAGIDGTTIEDLESKNGTFVGGMRLTAPRRLEDGDEILIGSELLTYCAPSEGSTQTGSSG